MFLTYRIIAVAAVVPIIAANISLAQALTQLAEQWHSWVPIGGQKLISR